MCKANMSDVLRKFRCSYCEKETENKYDIYIDTTSIISNIISDLSMLSCKFVDYTMLEYATMKISFPI